MFALFHDTRGRFPAYVLSRHGLILSQIAIKIYRVTQENKGFQMIPRRMITRRLRFWFRKKRADAASARIFLRRRRRRRVIKKIESYIFAQDNF